MSTPADFVDAKRVRAERFAARRRIQALAEANKKFGGDPDLALPMEHLLNKGTTPDNYQAAVETLQIQGFLYQPEEFQKLVSEFRSSAFGKPIPPNTTIDPDVDLEKFLDFLMQKELDKYLVGKDSEKNTGYTALYRRMQQVIDPTQSNVADDKLKEAIEQQNKIAAFHDLPVRVNFYLEQQKAGSPIEIPPALVREVQKKYANWDGKTPLPEVQLKRESATRAEIRADKMGVSLDQLMDIMNEHGEDDEIELDGVDCKGNKNPFRAIIFQKDGKFYTIGAALDKDGTFKVHAYECDEDGKLTTGEIADPEGWMTASVESPPGPAGMDVTEAVADACTKLAAFKKPDLEATVKTTDDDSDIDEEEEEEEEDEDLHVDKEEEELFEKTTKELDADSVEKVKTEAQTDETVESPIQAAKIEAERSSVSTLRKRTDQPPRKAGDFKGVEPIDFGSEEIQDGPKLPNLLKPVQDLRAAVEAIKLTTPKPSEPAAKPTQPGEPTEAEIKAALVEILRLPGEKIREIFKAHAGVLPVNFTPIIMNLLERGKYDLSKNVEDIGYPSEELIKKAYEQGLEKLARGPNEGDIPVKDVLNNMARGYINAKQVAVAAPAAVAAAPAPAPAPAAVAAAPAPAPAPAAVAAAPAPAPEPVAAAPAPAPEPVAAAATAAVVTEPAAPVIKAAPGDRPAFDAAPVVEAAEMKQPAPASAPMSKKEEKKVEGAPVVEGVAEQGGEKAKEEELENVVDTAPVVSKQKDDEVPPPPPAEELPLPPLPEVETDPRDQVFDMKKIPLPEDLRQPVEDAPPLAPPPPPVTPTVKPAASLLSQIQEGRKLKKAEDRVLASPKVEDKDSMMKEMMAARRVGLGEDEDEDEDEDENDDVLPENTTPQPAAKPAAVTAADRKQTEAKTEVVKVTNAQANTANLMTAMLDRINKNKKPDEAEQSNKSSPDWD